MEDFCHTRLVGARITVQDADKQGVQAGGRVLLFAVFHTKCVYLCISDASGCDILMGM